MMEARHFRRKRIGCAYKGKLHTMVKFNPSEIKFLSFTMAIEENYRS
jgi:hypothetical protein